MISVSHQLRLLYIVSAGYWAASQMIRPVVAMFLVALGASPAVVGIVVGIQSFVPLFLAIPAGSFADRFGYRRFLTLGSLAMAGAGVLYICAALSHAYVTLVVAQVIEGLFELFVWTSAQAYVTQLGRDYDADRNVAHFSFFSALGQMAGPAIGGFVAEKWGYTGAFGVFAAMCAGLFVSACALPEHKPAPVAGGRVSMWLASRRICANPEVQIGMIGTFANLFITGMWTSFYPVYLISAGFTPSISGFLISLKGLASLAARPFVSPIVRCMGHSSALILASVVAVAPVAATPLIRNVALLGLAALASGIGLGLNLPLTIAIMARNTRPEERGIGMGLRLVMNRVALLTNPLIFGLVSEYAGFGQSFYVCSAIVAVLMLLAVRRWRFAVQRQRG